MYNEMLWIFTQLPDDYIVLDTETTGLPDESGLPDHVARYRLVMPEIQGVFCSQKAAIPWAQAMDLPCSHRGPSLNALMKVLNWVSSKTGDLHSRKFWNLLGSVYGEHQREHEWLQKNEHLLGYKRLVLSE